MWDIRGDLHHCPWGNPFLLFIHSLTPEKRTPASSLACFSHCKLQALVYDILPLKEGIKQLASWKIWSVEELEILLALGTKPGTPHHHTWKREALKEEALDYLPWKDEKGPSSVRRTLELFQRQLLGNFCETRWSAYGLFRAHRHHLELNWTELPESDVRSVISLVSAAALLV